MRNSDRKGKEVEEEVKNIISKYRHVMKGQSSQGEVCSHHPFLAHALFARSEPAIVKMGVVDDQARTNREIKINKCNGVNRVLSNRNAEFARCVPRSGAERGVCG